MLILSQVKSVLNYTTQNHRFASKGITICKAYSKTLGSDKEKPLRDGDREGIPSTGQTDRVDREKKKKL